jgi:hypothetical protein
MKKSRIHIITSVAVSFLFIIVASYLFMRKEEKKSDLQVLLTTTPEFAQLTNKFLNDLEIDKYYIKVNNYPCNDKTWEDCPVYKSKISSDDSIEISKEEDYSKFMKKYKVWSFEKNVNSCKDNIDCVEIYIDAGDFSRCGFRYDKNSSILNTDSEYIKVNKIDDNWYSFCRDWN